MNIDLSQFHQVFFEESLEGLDVMEKGLLHLDPAAPDAELINEIFRAAHSIKGGSGTFGFSIISEFTHLMETLLDEVRCGNRSLTAEQVDLFLRSVDCLRSMVEHTKDGIDWDQTISQPLEKEFQQILNINSDASEDAAQQAAKTKITFKPDQEIFFTGNEPYRLFRELSELGEIEVEVDLNLLPYIADIEPEKCYLNWVVHLETDAELDQVKEVFEWVVDDAEITYEQSGQESSSIQAEPEGQDETADAKTAEQFESGPPQAKSLGQQLDQLDLSSVDKAQDQSNQTQPIQTKQPPASQPESKARNQAQAAGANKESSSIRVSIDRIDSLINMVGELVITQSMLGQLGRNFQMEKLPKLLEGLSQLEHNTRELQDSVMRIRMLPISFVFNRFPRLVRDISSKLNKKIELKISGENTELDKTVMEKIGDPLVHLLRNSLDHGLEPPEERVAAGKSEVGIISLDAFHQGGNIIIEVSDDGRGIHAEKILESAINKGLVTAGDHLTEEQAVELIFHPGFSTAAEISDISGRGVGMDVVRKNIQSLGGSVDATTKRGEGTRFTIRLPLTLAILEGQLVRVGAHTYVIPLVSIVESLQVRVDQVSSMAGGYDVFKLREEYVPIFRLYHIFDLTPDSRKVEDGLLVVVEVNNEKIGFVVDELLAQQQVVIKSLEANYQRVEGLSGATILGDGTVALIIDILSLARLANMKKIEDISQQENNTITGKNTQVALEQIFQEQKLNKEHDSSGAQI